MNENKINYFTDLIAWRKSYGLALEIYGITIGFPKSEIFGLVSQIRRSAVSVPSNLAEGYGRYHYKDRKKFYVQARGSLTELENHLIIANGLKYVPEEKLHELRSKIFEIYKIICGLINNTV